MLGHKLVLGGVLAALLVGGGPACGTAPPPPKHTGSRQEPSNDVERQILDRLDDWTGDQTIGGVAVHAEPPYFAASGATCRWLQLGSARRLACKNDPAVAGGWYYAPDVMVAPAPMP